MAEEEKDFILKDSEPKSDTIAADSKESPQKASRDTGFQLPKITFSTFMMSLNASALVNLGLIEDPISKTMAKNLPVGKQTIDMLRMLEEKTKGNLTKEEENLLRGILYDLKIAYVKQKG
jgi:hypothetical protein